MLFSEGVVVFEKEDGLRISGCKSETHSCFLPMPSFFSLDSRVEAFTSSKAAAPWRPEMRHLVFCITASR